MPHKNSQPKYNGTPIGRNLINQRSKVGVSGTINPAGIMPANITCYICRESKSLDYYSKRQVQRFQDTIRNPNIPGGRTKKDPRVTCEGCTPRQNTQLQCCVCDKVKGLSSFAINQRRNPVNARCIRCVTSVLKVEPDDPHFGDVVNSGSDDDDDDSDDSSESENSDDGDFDAASDDEEEKTKPTCSPVPGYVRPGAQNRAAVRTDNWGRPLKENRPVSRQDSSISSNDEEDGTSTSNPTEAGWKDVSVAGRGRGRGSPPKQPSPAVSWANIASTWTPSAGFSTAPTATATTAAGNTSVGKRWVKPPKAATSTKYTSTEMRESDPWDAYARVLTNQRNIATQTSQQKKNKKKKFAAFVDDEEDWD